MNRNQLVTALADRIETTRRDADAVVTHLVDIITASVAAGEDVAISGFAKFRRVDRPARMGRNPATGETIRIKAKRSAKITPLKSFKDAVLSGRTPAKKAPAKKTVAKKAPAKKAPAKKAPAKKAAAKKTVAKKAPAKKAPAKRSVAKKAPARRTPAKKTAKKAPARRR